MLEALVSLTQEAEGRVGVIIQRGASLFNALLDSSKWLYAEEQK